jgi:hypothetical protein
MVPHLLHTCAFFPNIYSILAVVSADIVKPFPDRPAEGFLNFQTSFATMSDPALDTSARWADRAVEVGRIVEKSIRESRAVDTEALCVVPGEKVRLGTQAELFALCLFLMAKFCGPYYAFVSLCARCGLCDVMCTFWTMRAT